MRNAEKYLAQGKIRLAIGEYEQVVKKDPKDFGTLNMLGDLYFKTSSKSQAVGCYTSVAEHYSKLGFAQKAIAVYNKISKIQPNSVEVSGKLAELYKVKGSVREARSHYVTLAEHYQSTGKKVEALAIWKQIALLDPLNTDVFLNIAKSYLEENQLDDAIEAYSECGNRYLRQNKHAEALECFLKAFDIRNDDPRALSGFVDVKFAMNVPAEAAEFLTGILEKQPLNRDVLGFLIECHTASGNLPETEKFVIRLVEQEPANYPKFFELAKLYLEKDELASVSRMLMMSSEHMLLGGQAHEFSSIVREVLERDPGQLEALRLLVRYCAWQKDDEGFREALVRLAGIANISGCVEDERYALSQLTMIIPQSVEYAERLKEINDEFGYENTQSGDDLFEQRFFKKSLNGDSHTAEEPSVKEYAEVDSGFDKVEESEPISAEADGGLEAVLETFHYESDAISCVEASDTVTIDALPASEEKLAKEVDSIRFYIESGYLDLADKAIHELRGEFGERIEIDGLRQILVDVADQQEPEAVMEIVDAGITTGSFDLGELRTELGFEESEPADDGDYETHYQTAVAYQEMGLMEQAIREFQDAVGLVSPNDGTRRFFQCANLLGHCFMQQGMPQLALTWFNRTLETAGLIDEEKQALWYEVAAAHEADGDIENAAKFFELVYAENVDFRDVRDRVKTVLVSR